MENYQAFTGVRLILISVPEARLDDVVRRLAAAPLDWPGLQIVLCDTTAELDRLRPLALRGARVAAVSPLDPDLPNRLLAEGAADVIEELRKRIDDPQVQLIDAPAGARRLQTAAESLLEFYAPVLVASLELLRRAGVPSHQYSAVVEKRALRVARTYARTGKRLPPSSRIEPRAMAAFCEADPRAARSFAESAARAARLLTPEPKARAVAS